MTPAEHHDLRTSLGAHALGQLSPAEAARVEEHLAGCHTCRTEHGELLPVVGALAGLRTTPRDAGNLGAAGVAGAEPDPPRSLEDRVVRATRDAGDSERRLRWLRPAAGFAVGAVAASAVLAATVGLGQEPTPPVAVPLEAVEVRSPDPGVDAEADLVAHTWGVEVKLSATGFDRGGRYQVVVVGDDGEDYPAGGFVGTGTVEMHCNLNSTVLRDSASGFEVRDAQGRVVVTSVFDA